MADERSDDLNLGDFSWEDRSDYRDLSQRPFADAEYRYSWLESEDDSSKAPSPIYQSSESQQNEPSESSQLHTSDASNTQLSWITRDDDPWAAGEYEPWQPSQRRLSLYEEPQFLAEAQYTTVTEFELESGLDSSFVNNDLDADLGADSDPYSSPVFPSGIDEGALRRFSPQINEDTPGRSIGIDEGIWHFSEDQDFEPAETHLDPLVVDDAVTSNENPQSTWETLRRVALLGLRPGEFLVDLPTLVEMQSSDSNTEPSRTPLVSTFEEVRQVLATMDNLSETPPYARPTHTSDAFSEIIETTALADSTPPNYDLSVLTEHSHQEEASQSSDEDVLAFPRGAISRDDSIDQHPFFTTMELKNLAFDQAGTLDTDLDKVSRRLQKKAWSRGQDDVVVKGRFGRQRGSHRSK